MVHVSYFISDDLAFFSFVQVSHYLCVHMHTHMHAYRRRLCCFGAVGLCSLGSDQFPYLLKS